MSKKKDCFAAEQPCNDISGNLVVLAEEIDRSAASELALYDLLKENNFRYIRLGRGAYRISKASFDAWLDQLNQD